MLNAEIVGTILTRESSTCLISTGADPTSNKDLLIVGGPGREEYLADLQQRLGRIGLITEACDDALVCSQNGTGVAYYQIRDFCHLIDEISSGRNIDPVVKPWAVGPWIPEAFAHDMHRSVILRDHIGISHLIRSFDVYPELLRLGVMRSTEQEVVIKSGKLITAENGLSRHMLASDIAFSVLRYVHAKGGVYFRGLRYLQETAPLLPDGLSAIAAQIGAEPELVFSDSRLQFLTAAKAQS